MSGSMEGPADLTPLQRKYIRNLWEYCQTPPTLGRIYAKCLAGYTFMLAVAGLVVYFCFSIGRFESAWLACGMFMGIGIRDLGMFRQAVELWPSTAAVIDRRKLSELANETHADLDRDDWS